MDLVIHLADSDRGQLENARGIVLAAIEDYLPLELKNLDQFRLASYLKKMFITPFQGNNENAWALFSLPGSRHPSIRGIPFVYPSLDIKFVISISRPYQFSVDSFQIPLDLVSLHHVLSTYAGPDSHEQATVPIPQVQYTSSYHSLREARAHLANKSICMRHPADMAKVHGGNLNRPFISPLHPSSPSPPLHSTSPPLSSPYYSTSPPLSSPYYLTNNQFNIAPPLAQLA